MRRGCRSCRRGGAGSHWATSVLIPYTENIVQKMTANAATFGSPSPALAVLTAAAADLTSAEGNALSRVKGAVAIRNEKRTALVTLLRQEASYVQQTADANVENGVSIIESAAMSVRKSPTRKPKSFEVLAGPTSGTAKLVTKSAGPRAAYEWQYSTDGGKTWVNAPGTMQAKTVIPGFTPGATVQFRYRPLTKIGEGDWSQVASLIIK
jgi:hypothetical protein